MKIITVIITLISTSLALNILLTSTNNWCSNKIRYLQQYLDNQGHKVILISSLYQQNLNLEIPENFKIGSRSIKNGGEFNHLNHINHYGSLKIDKNKNTKRGAKQVVLKKPEADLQDDDYNFQNFDKPILNNQYGQDAKNLNAWYINSNSESIINIALNLIIPKYYPDFKIDLVVVGPNDDTTNNDKLTKNILNYINNEKNLNAIAISTKDIDSLYFKDPLFTATNKDNVYKKNLDIITEMISSTIIKNINKLTVNDNKLSLFIKFPSLNHESSICKTPSIIDKYLDGLLEYQIISQRQSIKEIENDNQNKISNLQYVMESNGQILKIEEEISDEYVPEDDYLYNEDGSFTKDTSKNFANFKFINNDKSEDHQQQQQPKRIKKNHSERSLNDIREYILLNCNVAVEVLNPINPFKLRRILEFKNALKRAKTTLRPDPIDQRRSTFQNLNDYQDILNPLLINKYHKSPSIKSFNNDNKLKNNKNKPRIAPVALKNALNVPIEAVLNLNVRPGEKHFVMWFLISSYFPLIAACLGPLANMVSIIALIQHWRMDKFTGKLLPDPNDVLVLNVLSLVLGIIGNISLLMNFSRSVKYLITQCVSIFSWFCASIMLVAALLITKYDTMNDIPDLIPSEGFWFACFTAGYYFSCTVILLINFMGYRLNKYPPTFNLDQKQRTLMLFTILFAIWTICGAVAMEHLIKELTYGSSLYYCIVSFLTIGLGDITPVSSGAKVVVLVFSLGGVLIMGLIIATLRSVILSSASPAIFWNDIEIARRKLVEKFKKEHKEITPEESFREMRLIRKKVKQRHINSSLAMTIALFMAFWLVGGLVFHYIEGWTYFHSIYFCFLCLLTIGYGDFAPKTGLGRSFFVSWACGAVPLMTILVSNVGDLLYEIFNELSEWFSKWIFQPDANYEAKKKLKKEMEETQDDELTLSSNLISDEVREDLDIESLDLEREIARRESLEDENEQISINSIEEDLTGNSKNSFESRDPSDDESYASGVSVSNMIKRKLVKRRRDHKILLKYMNRLRPLMADTVSNPKKKYTHRQWKELMKALDLKDVPEEPEEDKLYDGFWLGDWSPLRLPLKEPNYLLLRVYFKIEETLQEMVDAESQDLKLLDENIDHRKDSDHNDNDSCSDFTKFKQDPKIKFVETPKRRS
ncbi:TOK1 [Candida jiufengensis]|uniref:TOK1 n=1 Tax=Candida jiufengensis TaxID=497108 RepID=UPI00222529EB|nr:TOK1 [Candida jiufengensis]KAI5955333.1 TOK1 [Candida jiufengensis]